MISLCIHSGEIKTKIAQQEFMMNEALKQYETTITKNELNDLEMEIKMTRGEWRIYVTKLVGQAWQKLVENKKDKSIVTSWSGTGLNLPITGENDNAWFCKMVEKYEGSIIEEQDIAEQILEVAHNTRGYQKLRVITKMANPGNTAIPPYKHPQDETDYDSDKDKWNKHMNEEDGDDSSGDEYGNDKGQRKKKKKKRTTLCPDLYNLCDKEYHIPTRNINNDSDKLPAYKPKKKQNIINDDSNNIHGNGDDHDDDDSNEDNGNGNGDDDDDDFNDDNDKGNNGGKGNDNGKGKDNGKGNDNGKKQNVDEMEIDSDDNNDCNQYLSMMIYRYVGIYNPYQAQCYIIAWIQSISFLDPHIIRSLQVMLNLKYNKKFNQNDISKLSPTDWNRNMTMFRYLQKIIFRIINPNVRLNLKEIYEMNVDERRIVIDPTKFHKSLPQPFCGRTQEDVQEFYSVMFEKMNMMKINSKSKKPMINSVFNFTESITRKCMECYDIRRRQEIQHTLQVIHK